MKASWLSKLQNQTSFGSLMDVAKEIASDYERCQWYDHSFVIQCAELVKNHPDNPGQEGTSIFTDLLCHGKIDNIGLL